MGKFFTLDEIDETITCMERRLAEGQGTERDSMCRLSLTMTHILRARIASLETDYQLLRDDYEMIAAGESAALERIASLEAEVERLQKVLERDLTVLKMAYCKHQLGDESVGWNELGDHLCDRICDHIGGNEFLVWVESLSPASDESEE